MYNQELMRAEGPKERTIPHMPCTTMLYVINCTPAPIYGHVVQSDLKHSSLLDAPWAFGSHELLVSPTEPHIPYNTGNNFEPTHGELQAQYTTQTELKFTFPVDVIT